MLLGRNVCEKEARDAAERGGGGGDAIRRVRGKRGWFIVKSEREKRGSCR